MHALERQGQGIANIDVAGCHQLSVVVETAGETQAVVPLRAHSMEMVSVYTVPLRRLMHEAACANRRGQMCHIMEELFARGAKAFARCLLIGNWRKLDGRTLWVLDDDLSERMAIETRKPNHHFSSSYSKLRSPFVPMQCSVGAWSGIFSAS